MTKKTIKRTLDLLRNPDPIIHIPKGGTFLFAKDQTFDEYGYLNDPRRVMRVDTWWLVDPSAEVVPLQIHIRGTDSTVPDHVVYLGTVFPRPDMEAHIWQKAVPLSMTNILDCALTI